MPPESTRRLTAAVDMLGRTIKALIPDGADPALVQAFEDALGDLLAEALNAASAQSAGAVLVVRDELDRRLAELEQARERDA